MENGNTVGRDTGDKYNLFLEAGAGLLINFFNEIIFFQKVKDFLSINKMGTQVLKNINNS